MPSPRRYPTREIEQRIQDGYTRSWVLLRSDLEALQARVKAARLAGEEVRRSWLLREARLEDTLYLLSGQISLLSEQAQREVRLARESAALAAEGDALEFLTDEVTFPARPSLQAMERLSSSGNIERLFSGLGPEAVGQARDKLISGLLIGKHPSSVARDLRTVLGGNMVRAQTIARTEILRAYRDAAQLTYARNSDVVTGWVWHSALDSRTCAMCWAMHGKVFDVEEKQATHAGCRCTLVPQTKDTRPRKTGEERLRDLPESEQRRILGPGRFRLWQDGMPLEQFASDAFRTPYGPGRRLRTIRELTT